MLLDVVGVGWQQGCGAIVISFVLLFKKMISFGFLLETQSNIAQLLNPSVYSFFDVPSWP